MYLILSFLHRVSWWFVFGWLFLINIETYLPEYRYLIMKKAFELAIAGNPIALEKVQQAFCAMKLQFGLL